MRHVQRGGQHLRVAEPSWQDPLSPDYARQRGGRWNPAGSFGVVYLSRTLEVARAWVRRKLGRAGIEPEDVEPEQGPVLVHTSVSRSAFVDAVSDAGLRALELPTTYPLDDDGEEVPHSACQPIGQAAWNAGELGIACRSAALTPPGSGEELAYFARRRLRKRAVDPFAAWYWRS